MDTAGVGKWGPRSRSIFESSFCHRWWQNWDNVRGKCEKMYIYLLQVPGAVSHIVGSCTQSSCLHTAYNFHRQSIWALSPSSSQSGNSFDGPRILRYYTYQDSRKLKEIMAQVSARMAAALARQGPKAAQLSKQVKFKWVSITCFRKIVCSDVKCGLCGEAAITSGHFKFQYSIMNKIIIVDS